MCRTALMGLFFFLALLAGTRSYAQGCYNEGFELSAAGVYTASNSIPGWTISCAPVQAGLGGCFPTSADTWTQAISEFSIRQTPLFGVPNIGTIPNSPLGGNKIAQLNDQTAGGTKTRIRTTYPVSNANSLLSLAFCAALSSSAHNCCSQPYIYINIYNCSGVLQVCSSASVLANGSSCVNGLTGFTVTNGVNWTNWTTRQIDLTPYLNSCITLEIVAADCSFGDHFGSLFIDASCGAQNLPPLPAVGVTCFPLPVNYCAGSSVASLFAPTGYVSYSWTAPSFAPPVPASQATLSAITISNPIPGSVYSVQLTSPANCIYIATYTIAYSTVSISALASTSTCAGGSTGSGTVVGTGSGTGYTYTWTNSSNSVISTGSTVANLGPGVYSVSIGAVGNSSCGVSSGTIQVGNKPPEIRDVSAFYCGAEARLGTFQGSNFTWFVNGAAIPFVTGPGYTVTSPVPNSTVGVTFTTSQGCTDSLRLTLVQVSSGSTSVVANPTMCASSANGTATLSISPQTTTLSTLFTVSIIATGSNAPLSYTLSSGSSSINLINLMPGPYSYTASDGYCLYTSTFSKAGIIYDFTVSAANQLCGNNCQNAIVTLTSNVPASSFNFSWSPAAYLFGAGPGKQICPSLAPGTQTAIQYTVTATPTVANCLQSKTLTVNISNPPVATISAIPAVCHDSGTIQVLATPPGGTFVANNFISAGGIFTPSLTTPGTKTVSYLSSLGSCTSAVNATVQVLGPQISLPTSTSICAGGSVTFSLSSAYQYTWSNGSNSATAVYSTSSTASQSVIAFDPSSGCSFTQSFVIVVNALPAYTLTGPSQTCSQTVVAYAGSPGNSYQWGNASGGLLVFTANQDTTIEVTITSPSGCPVKDSIQLKVFPYPVLNVVHPQLTCRGSLVTFSANGATSYAWSMGGNSNQISYLADSSTVITVLGQSNGCSTSYSFQLSVQECQGLKEQQKDLIYIYPNPAENNLSVEIREASEAALFGSDGRLIENLFFGKGTTRFPIEKLEPGLYFIRVQTSAMYTILSFVKE